MDKRIAEALVDVSSTHALVCDLVAGSDLLTAYNASAAGKLADMILVSEAMVRILEVHIHSWKALLNPTSGEPGALEMTPEGDYVWR
jgi:hypothetical protein